MIGKYLFIQDPGKEIIDLIWDRRISAIRSRLRDNAISLSNSDSMYLGHEIPVGCDGNLHSFFCSKWNIWCSCLAFLIPYNYKNFIYTWTFWETLLPDCRGRTDRAKKWTNMEQTAFQRRKRRAEQALKDEEWNRKLAKQYAERCDKQEWALTRERNDEMWT